MTEIGNERARARFLDHRLTWLYRAGAAAALLAGVLFFLGALELGIALIPPGGPGGPFSAFQDNWLIVIFKLHAGFSGIQIGLLHVLNSLDIAILALVGVTMVALCAALRATSRVWSLIAAIQPFLGIVLFMATKSAGRSAVMGAALVISVVMLRSEPFGEAIACMGIAASVLLLVGDFSAGMPPSAAVAALFGMAYVLFIAWFLLIARKLLHADRLS